MQWLPSCRKPDLFNNQRADSSSKKIKQLAIIVKPLPFSVLTLFHNCASPRALISSGMAQCEQEEGHVRRRQARRQVG